jgi:uncharacterized membrane protein YoaK (UPF0700 family)
MQLKTSYVVAIALTCIAGFVDAVGYINLGRIYTANMSGNSVGVGIELSSRNWIEMLRRAWPVLAYVVGLLFCRILLHVGAIRGIRRMASAAFSCEIVLLILVCSNSLFGHYLSWALPFAYIGLMAVAMGIQNAALTHFSSLTLHTGFVTGTLVKFAEQLAKYLVWLAGAVGRERGSLKGLLDGSRKQQSFQVAAFLAIIWTTYVIGALGGALGTHRFGLRWLIPAILSLAALIGVDLTHPLAVRDEQEQAGA